LIPSQFRFSASIDLAYGSGRQLTYSFSCVVNLSANRSNTSGPHSLFIALNTCFGNIQLLRSMNDRDCSSAIEFRAPGKYSAVRVN